MLRWHRLIVVYTLPLLRYVVITGLGIQGWDLLALTTKAPATAPNILMMRQHIYGPANYAVVAAPDYTASALPQMLDMPADIVRASALARAAALGERCVWWNCAGQA